MSQLGRHHRPKLTVAKEPLKKNGRGPFPSKVIAESQRATSGCLGMNQVIVLNCWTHALLPFPTPTTSSQGHCPNLFILSRPPVCTCQCQWWKKTRNESLKTLKNPWLSFPPFFPSFFFSFPAMICDLQDFSSYTKYRTWAQAVKVPSLNHFRTTRKFLITSDFLQSHLKEVKCRNDDLIFIYCFSHYFAISIFIFCFSNFIYLFII